MELFVRALESCFWGGGGEHEGMGLRQWRWGGATESCSTFSQHTVFVLIWCAGSPWPKQG